MVVAAHQLGSDVLVWSAEGDSSGIVVALLLRCCICHADVDLLRTKWHILGNLVGAQPDKPMQNLQLSLPLLLLPEEVSLLLHKGGCKRRPPQGWQNRMHVFTYTIFSGA